MILSFIFATDGTISPRQQLLALFSLVLGAHCAQVGESRNNQARKFLAVGQGNEMIHDVKRLAQAAIAESLQKDAPEAFFLEPHWSLMDFRRIYSLVFAGPGQGLGRGRNPVGSRSGRGFGTRSGQVRPPPSARPFSPVAGGG